MERIIKFRAWDTHNERMVFDPWKFQPMQQYQIENYEWKGDHTFYEDWNDCEDGIDRPCFLMQFTGLQDKNGKDIYEGDIVNYPFKKFNGKIEFNDGGFCITHNAVCKCELNKAASLSIEVIGNIYSTPELLT